MKQYLEKYRELIVYFIVGCLTTLVNWVVYAAGVEVFHLRISIANGIAWVVAVAFAYITNKIWVFQSRQWNVSFVLREAGLFVSARILTGILEIAGVPLLVKAGLDQSLFGVRGMWAKVIVNVAVLILNYVFSKLVVFRSGTKTGRGA